MCYTFDPKKRIVKRVAVPIAKSKLPQTDDMKAYLKQLRERYLKKNQNKGVERKIKLKPAEV